MRRSCQLAVSLFLLAASPRPAGAHFVSGPNPVAPFYMVGAALPRAFPDDGLRAGRWTVSGGGMYSEIARPRNILPIDLINVQGGGGYLGLARAWTEHAGAGALFALNGAHGTSAAAFQPYGNCSGTEFCAPPDRIGDSTGGGFLGAAYAVLDPTAEGSVVRLPFILGLAYVRADLRTDLSGDFPPEGGGLFSYSTLNVRQVRAGGGPLLGASPRISLGRWVAVSPFIIGVPAGMHESRECSFTANADCADPGRVDEPLVYTGVTATVRPAHLSVTYVPAWKAAGAWALTAGFYLSF